MKESRLTKLFRKGSNHAKKNDHADSGNKNGHAYSVLDMGLICALTNIEVTIEFPFPIPKIDDLIAEKDGIDEQCKVLMQQISIDIRRNASQIYINKKPFPVPETKIDPSFLMLPFKAISTNHHVEALTMLALNQKKLMGELSCKIIPEYITVIQEVLLTKDLTLEFTVNEREERRRIDINSSGSVATICLSGEFTLFDVSMEKKITLSAYEHHYLVKPDTQQGAVLIHQHSQLTHVKSLQILGTEIIVDIHDAIDKVYSNQHGLHK